MNRKGKVLMSSGGSSCAIIYLCFIRKVKKKIEKMSKCGKLLSLSCDNTWQMLLEIWACKVCLHD